MSDPTLEFAEERGLGKVRGRVRLDSGMPLAGGPPATASLLLTSSGLWLVAARDRFHGLNLDLLARSDVRLVAGRLRDRLCFAEHALTIPAGRRHAVERLIALSRLAAPDAVQGAAVKPSRLIHEIDELGSAWLGRELVGSEVLICWLPGSAAVPIASSIAGEAPCNQYLFLTDRRAAFVAYGAVGDVSYVPLLRGAVQARAVGEKTELSSTGGTFISRRRDALACRDASDLLDLEPGKARLLEAARRTWLGRSRGREPEERARTLALLDAAIEHGSQRARFARLLAAASDGDSDLAVDPQAAQRALGDGRLTPVVLADLWTSFRFSIAAGSALVRGLLDVGEAGLPFALALQRRVHVEPSVDEDIARDELRLTRFAVNARLESAATIDARDLTVRDLLCPGGLASAPRAPLPAEDSLSSELISGTLCHPLARGHGSLVASAQKLIAQNPEPDHAALGDYCEVLDTQGHPEARRALDAARLAFSLPNLHAYVSRGKKSIGLRGYEAKAPYILLGRAHLDPASPFRMNEAELFFAIGAEALHLKLGQARLTSNDVWAGAFARTKGGVELVIGLLPLLRGLPLAASVTRFLDKIPEPALRRGLEALVRFEQSKSKAPLELGAAPSALSHINENLVAAHRLMQMSADRAGAVLCGDLRASVRGLLLVRPDTRVLLDAMQERDLVSVLLERDADLALRGDLIVRVAALLEFYLGEDYLALRRALNGGSVDLAIAGP